MTAEDCAKAVLADATNCPLLGWGVFTFKLDGDGAGTAKCKCAKDAATAKKAVEAATCKTTDKLYGVYVAAKA
jgi:hypothetical protein